MPRILDVGCGRDKYPGAIGIDINPATAADVLCDLDLSRLPFADDSFDEVRAVHVVEHVDDMMAVMEELHRVTRAGGRIFVVTPHYSDVASWTDPTHKRHCRPSHSVIFGRMENAKRGCGTRGRDCGR
jgi:SAM-dependent methyltransferase